MLVSGSHRLQSAPTLLWFMICLENTMFSQRICFIQEWLSIREPGEPGGDHPRRQARRVGYFLFRCSNKLLHDSGLGSIGYHGVTNPHPNHLHPFTLLGNSYSAFRRGSVLMCPEIWNLPHQFHCANSFQKYKVSVDVGTTVDFNPGNFTRFEFFIKPPKAGCNL